MHAAANGSRTLVKICGVRSPDEAVGILRLGADAIGVVVAEGSPRQLSAGQARAIGAAVGPRSVLVGRGTEPEWADLARSWPGPVQIHGEPGSLGRSFIRALAAGADPSPHEGTPVACLLDAPSAGSGERWEWSLARSPWPGLPVILAGGLHAGCAAEAIRAARPWAVDVSSGVERRRGMKDLALVSEFIAAVRACDAELGRSGTPEPAGFADLR